MNNSDKNEKENIKNVFDKKRILNEITKFCKKYALGIVMIPLVFFTCGLIEGMTLLQIHLAMFVYEALLDK
ncbi:MAG: hypothetical protein ACLSVX_01215 [Massilimicrobiota timonensis]